MTVALFLSVLVGILSGAIAMAVVLLTIPGRWLRAKPRGSLTQADYLAVFALGLGRDSSGNETAGASNDALADWLLANNPQRKPTVVQEGIYLALRQREHIQPDLALSRWVHRLPHDPNVDADTVSAALQCWTLASARGWSRPAVVAHDLQQQRMAWLFQHLYGEDRVVVPELPEIPFDPTSTQHAGTRSQRIWLLVEVMLARPAMGRWGGALIVLAVGLVAALFAGAIVGWGLGVMK